MHVLDKAIHRKISTLPGRKIKMLMLQYLEHRASKNQPISFTVLFGSYHLHFYDLVEYLAHSLSLIFLFAPLLRK